MEDERFRAVPFDPQDVIEAVVRPARPPIVKQRAVRGAIDPEVAGPGLAVARIQIAHGSFVHLQIPRGEQACPQEPVKRAQPTGGQGFPVHHRLAEDRTLHRIFAELLRHRGLQAVEGTSSCRRVPAPGRPAGCRRSSARPQGFDQFHHEGDSGTLRHEYRDATGQHDLRKCRSPRRARRIIRRDVRGQLHFRERKPQGFPATRPQCRIQAALPPPLLDPRSEGLVVDTVARMPQTTMFHSK